MNLRTKQEWFITSFKNAVRTSFEIEKDKKFVYFIPFRHLQRNKKLYNFYKTHVVLMK